MTNQDLLIALLKTLFTISSILCLVMIVAHNMRSSHWSVRMFDFPVKQAVVLELILGALLAVTSYMTDHSLSMWWFIAPALPTLLLIRTIIPYTRIYPREVKALKTSGQHDLSILMANVFMHNRNYESLISLIKDRQPDCVLLMETDADWARAMESIHEAYPYKIQHPQENTYGMLFFSKREISQPQVRFILKDDIPSVRLRLEIKPGVYGWFYGVHPEPPSPTESDTSEPRDIELLKLAREIKTLEEPVLFMGDFNDVAWSHSTRLFRRYSGLLDPRIGVGSFNTFHTRFSLLRWPLDHCFVSKHYKVDELEVLRSIDSDHFPVLVKVALDERVLPADHEVSLEDKLEVAQKLELEKQH